MIQFVFPVLQIVQQSVHPKMDCVNAFPPVSLLQFLWKFFFVVFTFWWVRVVLCYIYLFYFSLIAFQIQHSLPFPHDNQLFCDLKALYVWAFCFVSFFFLSQLIIQHLHCCSVHTSLRFQLQYPNHDELQSWPRMETQALSWSWEQS